MPSFHPRIWGFEGSGAFLGLTKVWRREQRSVIKIRLNNTRRRHVSQLDCCAAHAKASAGRLPSTKRATATLLDTDVEMDFPGNQRAVSDLGQPSPYNSPSSLPL